MLSLFVLITRLIMFIMRIFYPVLGLIYGLAMVILYAVSVYGQAGPDHADPTQQSNIAWYIRMSCAPAIPYGALEDCKMAKATFGVTVWMVYVTLNPPLSSGQTREIAVCPARVYFQMAILILTRPIARI